MTDKKEIREIVESGLKNSDNYLIDITVNANNVITVEIDNDKGVNIDDCAELSRYIEARLDRNKEDYELEVVSTGITSPLKIQRQYIKNIGNDVEMILASGEKLKGLLKAADYSGATITIEKKIKPEGAKKKVIVTEDLTYKYNEIKYTKPIINF